MRPRAATKINVSVCSLFGICVCVGDSSTPRHVWDEGVTHSLDPPFVGDEMRPVRYIHTITAAARVHIAVARAPIPSRRVRSAARCAPLAPNENTPPRSSSTPEHPHTHTTPVALHCAAPRAPRAPRAPHPTGRPPPPPTPSRSRSSTSTSTLRDSLRACIRARSRPNGAGIRPG